MLSTAPGLTFDEVASSYLADEAFQKTRPDLLRRRDASIPALQNVTLRFVRNETNLQTFRTQLQNTLSSGEDWGANGFGFMMELNKFGKYHLSCPSSHSGSIHKGNLLSTMIACVKGFSCSSSQT